MANPRVSAGGGWPAVFYVLRKGREAGGWIRLLQRLRSRNACKTCALGMGGARGGMVNEAGHFPEICKKSVQAQAGDMAGVIGEEFLAATSLAQMEGMTSAELERLGRVAFPMAVDPGGTHFRRVSWDEALDRSGDALRNAGPERSFFYSSGRASNEAAFLLQVVGRAFGTNNIHNCSFYCHAASSVALREIYGSATASVTLEDLDHADLAVVVGANPASNHPRLISKLVQMRRRGGHVLVINPLRELGLERFRVPSDWRSFLFGSEIASLYLQPHIGSDVAVFQVLVKGLLERGEVDRAFLEGHTTGWPQVEAQITALSWQALLDCCGLERGEIDRAVEMLATSQRGLFLWAMGLTHHENGVDNILALGNLALARGWLGRRGAGLLPIRGHSNVQGVGSVGVAPLLHRAFAAKLEERYGISIPPGPGLDTYQSMVASEEGRIDAAVLLGGNLFASNPDRAWAGRAMRRIGLTCSVTTKLNEGHIHGRGLASIVLPVLARDEESQGTTQESMFNYVRYSEGGEPAVKGEMRSEVDVLSDLAIRILPPGRFDWSTLRSHDRLREEIANAIPGFGPLAEIGRTRREFQIEGRTFHQPRFGSDDGYARCRVTPLPVLAREAGEFRLMTLRSEGQFNTVVYEEEDLYRGNLRRDVVMMSASDAAALGLREGDRVVVSNETGRMTVRTAIVDIRAGNLAMYYPEANLLVPRRLDPRSGTPAFKSVRVRLERVAAEERGERAR